MDKYRLAYQQTQLLLTDLLHMRALATWENRAKGKSLLLWIAPHPLLTVFIQILTEIGFEVTYTYALETAKRKESIDLLLSRKFDYVVNQDGVFHTILRGQEGTIIIENPTIRSEERMIKLCDWSFLQPYLYGNAVAQCILMGITQRTNFYLGLKTIVVQGDTPNAQALLKLLTAFTASTYSLTSQHVSKLQYALAGNMPVPDAILQNCDGFILTQPSETLEQLLKGCKSNAFFLNAQGEETTEMLCKYLKTWEPAPSPLSCFSCFLKEGKSVLLYDNGMDMKRSSYETMPNDAVDAVYAGVLLALEKLLGICDLKVEDLNQHLAKIKLSYI